ncbi:MAG: hypothetical protein ACPGPD_11940 [Pseudomonadales bacterium]
MNRIHPVSVFLITLLLVQAGSVSGLCCLEMQGSQHHAEGSQHHAEGSQHHAEGSSHPAEHHMAGHHAGHDRPATVTQSDDNSGCESLTCSLQGCSSSSPALAPVILATDRVSDSTTAVTARFDLYQTGVDSLYRPPKS